MASGWTYATAAVGGTLLATIAGRVWSRIRCEARLQAVARSVTARYARLLAVKQKQLVVHDGYGNYQLQPWIDHVDYFIGHVILREARQLGLAVDAIRRDSASWSALTRTLLATLHARTDGAIGPIGDAEILSGEHYETLCRNLLLDGGWRVDTTPVTGDQGADLIAESAGCRVVIQCKFYSKPVGNKAVQEAHAARGFHAGDCAAVVSNASFTRAARQLAQANGVLLLHHDQLAELDHLIAQERAKA